MATSRIRPDTNIDGGNADTVFPVIDLDGGGA